MTSVLVLLAAALQANPQDSYVRTYGFRWSLDGQSGPYLRTWEGGDLRLPVLEERGEARIGSVRREDVACTLSIPKEAVLTEWMRGALAGTKPSRQVLLFELARDGTLFRATDYGASVLTEIGFPACNADELDVESTLSLKFAPSSSQTPSGVPALPAAAPSGGKEIHAKVFSNRFKVAVDGLDASAVMRVSKVVARFRPGAAAPQVSTIVLSLAETATARGAWRSWFEASVEKGTPTEKGGRLEFGSGADGLPVMAVNLQGLAILRMSRATLEGAGNAGSLSRFEIELSCRGLALEVPGAPAAVAPTSPAAAPPAAAKGDEGARDPADFPRLKDTVRTSYFSSRNKTGTTESATYATPLAPEAAARDYERALAEAGWEQVNRIEAGGKDAQTIVLQVKKATRSAQVSIVQKKAGTDIVVNLTQTR